MSSRYPAKLVMLTQRVIGLRLRSQYSKEANKNGNHVAISQQTPRLQKGEVYVNVTTVLFRLKPMQRSWRYSGIFPFAGRCKLQQPRYPAQVPPYRYPKVDLLKRIAEGVGRYVVFGFECLSMFAECLPSRCTHCWCLYVQGYSRLLRPLLPWRLPSDYPTLRLR